ncbi:hypothetical protein [Amycolatopsis sp. DSM 110486]|uniref:hypothetical protein n=1 Tax=Amycolatopsis sp. DSM 110486 TaxID=2865832 RepID=UPI00351DA02B
MKSALRKIVPVAALAAVGVLGFAVPALAATTVSFDCQADAPIVGPQQVSLTQDADVTAPATVAPGGALDVVVDPAARPWPHLHRRGQPADRHLGADRVFPVA